MQLIFDLDTTGFSLVNARACAAAAKAAYVNAELPSPPAPLPSDGRGWPDGGDRGFSRTAFIECRATNTQALVIDCGVAVVVAFRGTQEPLDFVTDAAAWRRNIKGCTVHFGFWKAMTSVFQPVCAAIRKVSGNGESFKFEDSSFKVAPLPGPLPAPSSRGEGEVGGFAALNKPLFITGHSLGGALAVLFAYRYIPNSALSRRSFPAQAGPASSFSTSGGEPTEEGRRDACPTIYTFGQPRVGDANFARLYNRFHGDQTFRVVNDQDIVPRVPGWLLGYRHCGSEALLSAECGIRSAELGDPDLKFQISNLKSAIPHSEFRSPHSRVLLNPRLGFKLMRDAWALWRARKAGPLALTGLLRDHHMDQYLRRLGN